MSSSFNFEPIPQSGADLDANYFDEASSLPVEASPFGAGDHVAPYAQQYPPSQHYAQLQAPSDAAATLHATVPASAPAPAPTHASAPVRNRRRLPSRITPYQRRQPPPRRPQPPSGQPQSHSSQPQLYFGQQQLYSSQPQPQSGQPQPQPHFGQPQPYSGQPHTGLLRTDISNRDKVRNSATANDVNHLPLARQELEASRNVGDDAIVLMEGKVVEQQELYTIMCELPQQIKQIHQSTIQHLTENLKNWMDQRLQQMAESMDQRLQQMAESMDQGLQQMAESMDQQMQQIGDKLTQQTKQFHELRGQESSFFEEQHNIGLSVLDSVKATKEFIEGVSMGDYEPNQWTQ